MIGIPVLAQVRGRRRVLGTSANRGRSGHVLCSPVADGPDADIERQLIIFRIDPIFTESLKKLVDALPNSIFQPSPGVQSFGFIKVPIKRASNSWPGRC
jgi:hypothetical protein